MVSYLTMIPHIGILHVNMALFVHISALILFLANEWEGLTEFSNRSQGHICVGGLLLGF